MLAFFIHPPLVDSLKSAQCFALAVPPLRLFGGLRPLSRSLGGFINFFLGVVAMATIGKLIQKQVVNGWFVRLVFFRGKYLVNVFTPNGGFFSQQFNSLVNAQKFFSYISNQIKNYNNHVSAQLSLF